MSIHKLLCAGRIISFISVIQLHFYFVSHSAGLAGYLDPFYPLKEEAREIMMAFPKKENQEVEELIYRRKKNSILTIPSLRCQHEH